MHLVKVVSVFSICITFMCYITCRAGIRTAEQCQSIAEAILVTTCYKKYTKLGVSLEKA